MKRLFIVLAVLIPCALFLVARQAASWRPQLVYQAFNPGETFYVSPQARWMLCKANLPGEKTLIDLSSNRAQTLPILGEFLEYTPDENAVLVRQHKAIALYEIPSGRLRQSFAADADFRFSDLQFSADGEFLTAVNTYQIRRWNATTGEFLGQRAYNLDYRPPVVCGFGLGANQSFRFGTAATVSYLSDDGTLIESDKTFVAATGKEVAAPAKLPPAPDRFNVWSAQNFIRVTDRQNGKVVLLEDSIDYDYTPDERWLINTQSAGVLQIIDTNTWKIVARRDIGPATIWTSMGLPDFLLTVDKQGRVYRWRLR